jgi:hypothetical protein
MFDSWLMDKPPLWMKLWIWTLGQANWKDRAQLKRGQFITTAEDMREAMSYRVGARIQRPSEKEIRRAYEGLTKGGAVGRTKSTRGMVITVCNYGKYQRFESYEGQCEGHHEKSTKGIGGAHDTEGIRSQEGIKGIKAVVLTPQQQRVFDCCQTMKGKIFGRFPHAAETFDIEVDKCVAFNCQKNIGADPSLVVWRWFEKIKKPRYEVGKNFMEMYGGGS